MSNPNNFIKIRLLSLIASGSLLLWTFFDANLSKSALLKDLGLNNSQILAHILVALIFFFLLESVLEYKKGGNEDGWQSRFQLIFIIVFAASSLLASYPKLVLNTLLSETTRKDLIIPIITASISSFGAIIFRVFFETAQVFYKLRKKLLPIQSIRLVISGLVILFGIAVLSFLSSGCLPASFATRHSVFIVSFLCLFITFTPKKKLYNENHLVELSKLSNYLDRQVELSNDPVKTELEKTINKKKLHKKIMRIIEKQDKKTRHNLKTRCFFLKDVKFQPVGNRLEPVPMDEEEKVLRIDFYSKDQGNVVESVDLKYKYLRSACKEIRRPNYGNDITGYLNPLALKAYSIQRFYESDPNILFFNMAYGGALKELKELVLCLGNSLTKSFDLFQN